MENLTALHLFDYIVILAYFIVIVFVGTYFSQFIKQAKDYFAAGASVPWWLAGISLWMASFSALLFVVYSELAYKYGFVSIVLIWAIVPAMVFASAYMAQRWRRARVMTPLGFMEERYNKTIHQVFVWTGIPLRLIDNAVKIYSTAIFLLVAVGESWFTLEICVTVVGLIMIFYALFGGQLAVIVTDFLQFIILCVAVLILFPVSLAAVGGVSGLVAQAPDSFFRPFSPPYGFFDWVMFALMITLSYNATWSLVQKYNCVASEKDARKVAMTVGVLSFIGPIIFFTPAMAARVLLPDLITIPENTRYVYVIICLKLLPAGIMGLMIAGMFSATLSTLGSEFNVLSGVLTKDFYGKVIRPDADEKNLIWWGRVNTAIIGLITILVAIAIDSIKGLNLWDIVIKAFGALGPAIMLPLIGGLCVKTITSRGAITGILAGTVSGISLVIINAVLLSVNHERLATDAVLSYWLKQGFTSISIGINITVTVLGMWVGSKAARVSESELERINNFFQRMSIPTPSLVSPEKSGKQSPFYMVGISLIFLGSVLIAVGLMSSIQGDMRGFGFNCVTGSGMVVLGLLLWLKTKIKTTGQT